MGGPLSSFDFLLVDEATTHIVSFCPVEVAANIISDGKRAIGALGRC